MTDTTAAAAASTTTTTASAPATPNLFQKIGAALSSDWSKFVAFLEQAEQNAGTFMTDVANGVEIGLERLQQAASYINGKAAAITAGATALSNAVAQIPGASSDSSVQKLLADINVGVNDAVAAAADMTNGTTAPNDPTIVTKAVQTIGAVQQLQVLLGTAGAAVSALTNNSSTATSAVTAASPSPNG
jgi:hypothetical protein